MPARTVRDVLSQDGAALAAALALSAGEARLEVQILLQHALEVNRAWLLAHPEQALSPAQQQNYGALLQRRLNGEPVAYIIGRREFFGLQFNVTPDTLIPRPDTELLVELALQRIPAHGLCRVLDLGTGSGAIALSIASERPDAEVTAVDASEPALQVARENASRLRLSNVSLLHGHWFSPLGGRSFDLVVSNPPYVAEDDEHLREGDVRFEPMSALTAGKDGLDDIRDIVAQACAFMVPGAWLLIEHGYDQAAAVRALLRLHGYTNVFSAKDLAGIERVSGGACGREGEVALAHLGGEQSVRGKV